MTKPFGAGDGEMGRWGWFQYNQDLSFRKDTEGAYGRIFEVTASKEIVWEYINPYFAIQNAPGESTLVASGEQNSVFRAFRYAPEQVPWL